MLLHFLLHGSILDADTICIAFVIWLVFFVDVNPCFISRNDATGFHHLCSSLVSVHLSSRHTDLHFIQKLATSF